MRVYLVRHGKAEEARAGQADSERSLSEKGCDDIRRLATRFAKAGIRWDALMSSPLARARQTAALLAKAGLASDVEECPELAPQGVLSALLPALVARRDRAGGDLALVGHLPALADWAEELVWGEIRGRLVLKPGGVVGIELPAAGSLRGSCELFLLLSPKLLP